MRFFRKFQENADAIFEGLSTHYKTNGKVAFGRRVILSAALTEYGWDYRSCLTGCRQ